MAENLIDKYREQLYESKKPHVTIVAFFCELYNVKKPIDKKYYGWFGRLVKIYGREPVFYALADMYSMDNVDHTDALPLLTYLTKKRVEKKHKIQEGTYIEDLTDDVEEIENIWKKMRKDGIEWGALDDK